MTWLTRKLWGRLGRWVLAGRPQVLRIHAGDVIAITLPGPFSEADAEAFRRRLEDAFGHGHEILILDAGTSIRVLRDVDGPGAS